MRQENATWKLDLHKMAVFFDAAPLRQGDAPLRAVAKIAILGVGQIDLDELAFADFVTPFLACWESGVSGRYGILTIYDEDGAGSDESAQGIARRSARDGCACDPRLCE